MDTQTTNILIVKRGGEVANYNRSKILTAIKNAFLDVKGLKRRDSRISPSESGVESVAINAQSESITDLVETELLKMSQARNSVHIEEIQDVVEKHLMASGEHGVARGYILYRNDRASLRETPGSSQQNNQIVMADGRVVNYNSIHAVVDMACTNLDNVHSLSIIEQVKRSLFQGCTWRDIQSALIMAVRERIEMEPNYSFVAARLQYHYLKQEAYGLLGLDHIPVTCEGTQSDYARYFESYIKAGTEFGRIDPELSYLFDIRVLGHALQASRDLQFTYLGMQTLYDRYFLHENDVRYELPQAMFMRVAMGLAKQEDDPNSRAIEFYNVLSSFDFMCSTPTLFNSGTVRPQLSSCYLTSVSDDLGSIYDAIKNNAMLQKYAGGLGNDWTNVRALNSVIKGTNGKSQGVIPFLKVVNDTAVAVNQGGKRKGAVCAYLETWHLDIEEFLNLRKNTGDDRRRCHDMNTANWIPDLFMKRVLTEEDWTLFSPEEVPGLHDLFGDSFETLYEKYEDMASKGEIRNFKVVPALELWRKMITMLFETGHPWVTFKDPCNVRSPQQHIGVVHSSNLCTEITLNTVPDEEIAVCNLGSVNLPQHIVDGEIDKAKLQRTVSTAMRMLDNVIDVNFYNVDEARNSNLKHRPVGLGLMGFQDALYKKGLAYEDVQAMIFADYSTELISYFAIQASVSLAKERGVYESYEGSLWSKGILPIDSIKLLAEHRGVDNTLMDAGRSAESWDSLREEVLKHGMRNSNCLAIAPTATISNICGVSQSIEPTFQNLYVKSNLSGEFTVVNPYLVSELRARRLWDEVMVNDLKYFDGSVQSIDRVPGDLKRIFKTAFEVDATSLVRAASYRQKWLDQSQSLNLYMAEPNGAEISNLYIQAWQLGLKTTYYLRSMGATHVEKSTMQDGKLNAVSQPQVCSIDDPDCESCQ